MHVGATPDRAGHGAFPLRRWVGHVILGETVGFLIPASGFAIAWVLGLSPWAALVLQVALGFGEGALLGLAQALALRGTRAQVPVARWTVVTGLAASMAWGLGVAPVTLLDSGVSLDPQQPLTLLVLVVGGAVLLLSIPVAQWTVLRKVVARAWRWIPVNMAAWLIGISFTLAPTPFVDESSPVALAALLFGTGGLLMATTVALLTGLGLRRMLSAG